MIRRLLFNMVLGRKLRQLRYRRRRFRRKLSPTYIVRWMIRKVVGALITFVILGALLMWYFHQGAMESIVAGDASILSLLPLMLGRWFELAVAFVVSVLAMVLPGGSGHDEGIDFD